MQQPIAHPSCSVTALASVSTGVRTRRGAWGCMLRGGLARVVSLMLLASGAHADPLSQPHAATRVVDGTPRTIELFTSQGCNSCPPADALLLRLRDKAGLIALSLHVDYWNNLGWQDPFSFPAASARQRLYAQRMGQWSVYTPQMVINGVTDALGSQPAAVAHALNATPRPRFPMHVRIQGDQAMFSIDAHPAFRGKAVLWVAEFDREHRRHVPRGENAGRTLRHGHVVRTFQPKGKWHGKQSRYPVNLADLRARGRDGVALFIQEGIRGNGVILAAAAVWVGDPG